MKLILTDALASRIFASAVSLLMEESGRSEFGVSIKEKGFDHEIGFVLLLEETGGMNLALCACPNCPAIEIEDQSTGGWPET